MKKFFPAFVLGFFAPFVFILGAEPFEKHGGAVMEMISACLAMGLYLVICLLIFMPKGGTRCEKMAGMTGMAAPIILAILLMLFVEKPQTVLEQGVPMLAAACIAIMVGAWGADRVHSRLERGGRRIINPGMQRCIPPVCAALIAGVAAVVAVVVIPAVSADPFPLAAPERANPAFWVSIILHGIAALMLTAFSLRPADIRRRASAILKVAAPLVFLLGLFLAAPGFAFRSHGPAMYTASTLLVCCSAADIIGAALLAAAVLLSPESELAGAGNPAVVS